MGRNVQQRRAAKAHRRKARQDRAAQHSSGELMALPNSYPFPGPWLDDLHDDPGPPDEALLDTSRCPVDPVCVGCGNWEGLHAVTSAFTRPGGWDIACATLCETCDGRSFLHLLDADALADAFTEHAAHAGPGP